MVRQRLFLFLLAKAHVAFVGLESVREKRKQEVSEVKVSMRNQELLGWNKEAVDGWMRQGNKYHCWRLGSHKIPLILHVAVSLEMDDLRVLHQNMSLKVTQPYIAWQPEYFIAWSDTTVVNMLPGRTNLLSELHIAVSEKNHRKRSEQLQGKRGWWKYDLFYYYRMTLYLNK